MKSIMILPIALAAMAFSLGASDFTGVYALVDKVVLEPSADKPEHIQIWGVFARAQPTTSNDYEAPQRGYLYFKLPKEKEDLARKQWADFKSIAGTRQVAAFGRRHQPQPRVRKADEKPDAPDVFDVGMGVVKVRSDTEYGPIRSLLEYTGR